MGRLIGSNNNDNFGETLFVSKAIEYLDDSNIIYRNRQVFGREFDVCILIPNKGILVVELKGWREENILRVENGDSVVVKTANGEIKASPQKQARGYRFSIERHIKDSIGKFPLVFQMVCLPQVSESFFEDNHLGIAMEKRFTLLKEEIENKEAFIRKIDEAYDAVSKWKREPFDKQTMLEVRKLFETDIDDETEVEKENCNQQSVEKTKYHEYDYSRFYYFASDYNISDSEIEEMLIQYMLGCKLYCVMSDFYQMSRVVDALDRKLSSRGLTRDKNNIRIAFDESSAASTGLKESATSFMAFNCAFSIVTDNFDPSVKSFKIINGEYSEAQANILRELANISQFNVEQYFVEHADPSKNVVIRAGAGTGKTFTMIYRLGFVCYAQNVILPRMADHIVMITFTNEAADNMGTKLKAYFRNCYLITSRVEYLEMISKIDHMQISTIHSYAKKLISQLGTAFGYGIDVGITSSEFYRRKKISELLDDYITKKEKEYGKSYTEKLGMPVYAVRDSVLEFISKLHNKSVDISTIEPKNFGTVDDEEEHEELHELLAYIIPAVEKEYAKDLLESDKVHLSAIMPILNKFIRDEESIARIKELRKDKNIQQFMFIDEFQDTDDTQIETLLTLAKLLDYKLFVVGDIKQCIYRFRGAEEKAFDQLPIKEHPGDWLQFSLQRNYRTDTDLLNLFDKSFSAWGARQDVLLAYTPEGDRLIGTKRYNEYLKNSKDKYFKKIDVPREDLRIPALIEEIRRIQKRIKYEESQGKNLSKEEKSIAILVRENWQAELVRMECARATDKFSVQTNTGGDLYMSQPAMDMMVLVNALIHFDEADFLYNLATSNFFNLQIPKSNLYEKRAKIRNSGWRAKADERDQTKMLIEYMNMMLVKATDEYKTWDSLIKQLRINPVLQVIRKIYSILEPWKNYSSEQWKQHYYQLNVDLLFEQLIKACNIDRLTINTLQEQLYHNIVSKVSVDSRTPSLDEADVPIQCITVHKSKGLEYGHVIMPFCSGAIDYIKKSKLLVTTEKNGEDLHIGYMLSNIDATEHICNSYYDEDVEKTEKSREETRILYVAMTRAIRSFSWISVDGKAKLSWQNLIETEA